MRPDSRTLPLKTALAAALLLLGASLSSAQTPAQATGTCEATPPTATVPPNTPPDATSGIRITVTGKDGKPVQRKRFFLLDSSVRAAQGVDWASLPKRDDFLKSASPQLREWLARHDCDTIYCPEYESEYAEAIKTVPEFKQAYDEGMRRYHNDKLALKWITVSFPLKTARTEYFKRKRAWLEQTAAKAGKVASVMTNEKGTAYFTGLKLRSYYISNLMPLGNGSLLWDCQVSVPPPLPRQIHSVSVKMSAPKQTASLK